MNVLAGILITLGVVLVLLAGVGLLRFPDVLTRANAATKAAGLGVACVLGGVAAAVDTPEAWIKLSLAVVLQFLTAPVAGHVIGRAAYRSGTPLWEGTAIDELRGFQERPHEPVGHYDDPREDGGAAQVDLPPADGSRSPDGSG